MAHIIGSELESYPPKKKHYWLWVVFTVVMVLVTVLGYFVWKDLEQEEILQEEISAYMELDFSEDEFVIDIKTTGDYSILERAIKTYFKDFSDLVKEIDVILEDEAFLNILSAENYEADGPEFTMSLQRLADVRSGMSNRIQKLSEMCTEEYLFSLIEGYDLDSYYVDFYKDLLYTDKDLRELDKTREELVQLDKDFTVFLDDCEVILKFLRENSSSWIIENDSIVFSNTDLLNKYTELTDKLVEDSEIESFL